MKTAEQLRRDEAILVTLIAEHGETPARRLALEEVRAEIIVQETRREYPLDGPEFFAVGYNETGPTICRVTKGGTNAAV